MNSRFGNYVIHERVGIGGMGEVFRATKHGPDGFEVQVAIKIILSHLAREEAFRKRFSREARLAASLKHPNIVQVNGFDIIDGILFIEMEYVKGGDLRRILRSQSGGGLSADESVAILHSVARGLEHAHCHGGEKGAEKGLIHCDLNPHNILISSVGEVKVADFGIARAVMGDASASSTLRGKLAYMSPEQLEGRELDRRTDLFSLGIIGYQLFSGTHPFERASEAATIAAIGNSDHLPLREAVQGLPAVLYDTIDGLLKPDPDMRPGMPGDVAKALEPLLHPSAASSLARRAGSLSSEAPGPAGGIQDGSITAPTLPQRRIKQYRPYLLLTTLALCLSALVFFLPAGGIKKDRSGTSGTPAAALQPPAPREQEMPAAPAASMRSVIVESEPPGALIMENGADLGAAPVEIRGDPGAPLPDLEARLYGYQSRSFTIPPGTRGHFLVNLQPLPTGTVRISARPWARVSFRGSLIGETPLLMKDIPVGRHTFSLSYDPMGIKKAVVFEVKEGVNTLAVDMRGKQ